LDAKDFNGAFVVIFYKRTGGVTGGVSELFKIIKENPGLRANILAEKINRPPGTIEKWLRKLKKEREIDYKGSSKTGGYFIS